MVVLAGVGRWYQQHRAAAARAKRPPAPHVGPILTSRQVGISLAVLIALIFSKFFYLASVTSYFTFYLIEKFALSVRDAQLHLFVFLAAVAVGTVVGGPIGDRIGRKRVIWVSILGALPFTVMLPYANLFWTGVLTIVIGLVISSAFSAIVVYAQELVPGKVGMVSGLFFGLAFGMGGIGAAVLGRVADLTSIGFVYHIVAFLPALGLLTALLPELDRRRPAR
jgi:FSR family fosmidomycin resistance protein-like MFS transporter